MHAKINCLIFNFFKMLNRELMSMMERPTLEHRLSNFIHKNFHIRKFTWGSAIPTDRSLKWVINR